MKKNTALLFFCMLTIVGFAQNNSNQNIILEKDDIQNNLHQNNVTTKEAQKEEVNYTYKALYPINNEVLSKAKVQGEDSSSSLVVGTNGKKVRVFKISNPNLRILDRFRNEETRSNQEIESIEYNEDNKELTITYRRTLDKSALQKVMTDKGIEFSNTELPTENLK